MDGTIARAITIQTTSWWVSATPMLQGTGGVDLGDILVMPIVEGRNWFWDPGLPNSQTEMQIDALGLKSGLVFGESESATDPSFRMSRKRRARDRAGVG